jgi:hypothetical protein
VLRVRVAVAKLDIYGTRIRGFRAIKGL